jgi:hypothetical protein
VWNSSLSRSRLSSRSSRRRTEWSAPNEMLTVRPVSVKNTSDQVCVVGSSAQV